MKKIYLLILAIFLFFSSNLLAEPNYVYHEASTNNIFSTYQFRNYLTPNSTQSLVVGFKVEYQNWWNQAWVYYTIDGSTPSGAAGVGSGTTLVVAAAWQYTDSGTTAEVVTATIPAQPAGTVVKYIVSARHSGGGNEIFANGPGSPCSCGTPTNNASLATVYNYTVANTNNVEVSATSGTTIGSYATLKAAFDAINAGTHKGTINISVYGNTTETASAVLNASGSGSASYTAINIKPAGGASRTISGAITAGSPLIDLNGADYVTIDGLNSGGNSLSISNTTVSATSGTSTIRFIADATNNTITNCTLLGSSTIQGVIFFSTGTTTGNISNTISNNNIGPAGTNYPIYGISSTGTSGTVVNTETITGNNIYDFFSASSASIGINVTATGNTGWTISNNKLYQTATRIYTTANTHNGIYVGTGSGYTISGNTIGYANSSGTGTTNMVGNSVSLTGTFPSSYTTTGTVNATRYIAINAAFTAGGTVSNIQGNTIAGFALYTSSGASTTNGVWCGINVTSGNANIGTTTGNTIGATTGNSSIYIASTTAGATVVGIYGTSTNTLTISNNTIGAIDASGTTTTSTTGSITGIDVAGTGTHTISNNIVGNTTANNLRMGSFFNGSNLTNSSATTFVNTSTSTFMGIRNSATGATQTTSGNTIRNANCYGTGAALYTGISQSGTVTTSTVSSNTISDMTVAGTGISQAISIGSPTTANVTNNTINNLFRTGSGVLYGILYLSPSTITMNANTISNLAINNTTSTSTLYGIYSASSPAVENVTNNTIFNLTSTSTSTITIIGWYNNTSTSGNKTCTGNTIYGLSAVGGATIYGIRFAYGGTANTIASNTIYNLSGGLNLYGLHISSGTTNNIYKNKIYEISSSNVSGVVYGMYISSGTTNNIYNNLVGNLSSTAYTSATAPYIGTSGIYLTGGTTDNLYNNTVYIGTDTSSGTNYSSNGIYASATPTTVLLQNNLVVNLSTPKGSGKAVGYQRSAAALTNYSTSSNTNSFYGTSGLFWDGTTVQTTLSGYKTYMSTRDQASLNQNPTFASTTGSATNYLHIAAGTTTALESGGTTVALFTTDFDGDTRPGPTGSVNGGGTAFDIGADEFDGIPAAPVVNSVAISPTGNQCTNVTRAVTTTVTPVSPLSASPLLNYSINGTAQTAISMTAGTGTLTTAGTWTATLPTVTPSNATVTWYVSATDGTLSGQLTGTSYADEPLNGVTATATASVPQMCPGGTTNLSSSFTNNTAAPSYTAPTAVTNPTTDEDLGNVTISQGVTTLLNNTSTRNSLVGTLGTATGTAGSFANYTSFGTFTLTPGQIYNFSLSSLQGSSSYGNSMAIYIDYNRDGDFNDAGENVYVAGATTSGAHTETGSFTVPLTASSGKTRMRVICNEGLVTGPTMAVGYGEFEEYMLSIAPTFASYSWSDGSNVVGTTQNLTGVTVAAVPTTFTVTATDSNGCTVSANTTITSSAPLDGTTITPSNTTICQSETTTLTTAVTGGCPTLTYDWTSTGSGYTFSSTSAASPTFTAVLPGTYTVSCMVTDAASNTLELDSVVITVTNPQPTPGGPYTICGSGSLTLSATPENGSNTLNWYAAATGGSSLATGTSYSTPTLSTPGTTNYYVEEGIVSVGSSTITIGTGTSTTSSTSYPTAFENYFYQYWHQFVYTAADLSAMGLVAGNITSLSYNISAVNSPNVAITDYTIKIASTSATTLSTFTTTGLTNVFGPSSVTPAVGWNTFTFSTPYNWDGTSNIIIDVRQTGHYGSANATTYYTTASNSGVYANSSTSNTNYWTSNPTPTVTSNRLNIRLVGQGQIISCRGSRVAVPITITTPPTLSVTANKTICNDEVSTLQVTSTLGDYSTYTWSPITGLYTDAAGTVPYVALDNQSTVYVRTSTAGTTTYTCSASGSGCTNSATSTVIVMPNPAVTSTLPFVCTTGTPTLSLSPATGYTGGSIQWYDSADGFTYNPISGANGVTYTPAAPVTSSTYFKANLKNSAGTTCGTDPFVFVEVSSPSITGTTPGSTCGTGTVNLSATTSDDTVYWYSASTGGSSLYTGLSYTTPSIASTTSYWAEAVSLQGTAALINTAPTTLGATTTLTANRAYYFTTFQSTKMTSVDIYPLASGESGVIQLRAGSSTSGTLLKTINFTTNVSGGTTAQTIPIDYLFAAGNFTIFMSSTPTSGVIRNANAVVAAFPITSSIVNITGNAQGNTNYTGFYNLQFQGVCVSSPRTEVVATYTAPPTLSVTANKTICNDEVSILQVTSTLGDYSTYTWAPITGLYTDAAGTVPYVALDNQSTVYVRNTTAGTTIYTCSANGGGCNNSTNSTFIVLPTATVISSPTSICGSGTPVLSLNPSSASLYSGATIQWYDSTDGVTYNPISGANSATYTPAAPITLDTYYKVNIKNSDGVSCGSDPFVLVEINNPAVISTTPDTICGVGSATLEAIVSDGTPTWYSASSGGIPIATGSTFNTPSISSTTNYYVSAENTSSYSLVTGSNSSTSNSSAVTPYYHGYGGAKTQYIFKVAELNAMGIYAGKINSLIVPITSLGTTTLNGFSISIGHTSQNAAVTNSAITSGLTLVYSNAAQVLTLGNNTYTFTSPFEWNGTSNIVISFSYSNVNSGGTSSYVSYTPAGFVSSLVLYSDDATATCILNSVSDSEGCFDWYYYGNSTSSNRPNFTLTGENICASSRTQVVASVTTPPVLTLSASSETICNYTSTSTVSVSSNVADFDTYTWSPATHVSGDQNSGWTFNPTATTTYTLTASQSGGSQCSNTATFTVNITPAATTVDITQSSESICGGVVKTLSATGGVGDYTTTAFTELANALPSTFSLTNTSGTGTAVLNSTYYSEGTGSVLFNTASYSANVQYAMNSNIDLIGSSSAQLTFSHIAALEGSSYSYDYGYVEYSTNAGGSWTALTSTDYIGTAATSVFSSGTVRFSTKSYAEWIAQFTSSTATPGTGPATSLWKTETFNIPAAALTSNQFRIRFRLTTDTSTNYYGWLIDNVKITKVSNGNIITWTPVTNLFTDAACTSAYVVGTYASTLYARPETTTTYTASATVGSCTTSDSVTYTINSNTYSAGVWSDSGNPPNSATQTAIIDDNITLGVDVHACGCIVKPTRTLTVPAGKTLTIEGLILNNGIIDIQHEGSLVQVSETDANNGSGSYIVRKNSRLYHEYDYNYWSSPVVGETVQDAFSTNSTLAAGTGTSGTNMTYVYYLNPANFDDANDDTWDDNGNDWVRYSTGVMNKGVGFIALGAGSDFPFNPNDFETGFQQNIHFDGSNVNNGTFTVNLVEDADASTTLSDNLIGNPYPSALDAVALRSENSALLGTSAYLWSHDTGLAAGGGPWAYNFTNADFATLNMVSGAGTQAHPSDMNSPIPNRYIASGQSFIVQATGSGTLTYKNSMRPTGENNHFLRSDTQVDAIWLNMTASDGLFRQLMVGFYDEAVDTFDDYDSKRMPLIDEADFYSLPDNTQEKLVIQGQTAFENTKTIPIGLTIVQAGTYEITVDQLQGIFTDGQKVYLEDTYLNVIHNLIEGPYTFNSEVGAEIEDRFILRFTSDALGIDEDTLSHMVIYPNPSKGQFYFNYRFENTADIVVYELTGKKLSVQTFNLSETNHMIDLSQYPSGVYYVKITDGSLQTTKKLIVE